MSDTKKHRTPNPLVDYIVLCTATILLNKDYPIGTYETAENSV